MAGPPAEPPLPRPIVRVLQRCLARSPFERFPDARALADALDAALRVAPVPGTRKDIGAQVKETLDRLAALNEGEMSGVVALNVGTGPIRRDSSRATTRCRTTEFVRPDGPSPGRRRSSVARELDSPAARRCRICRAPLTTMPGLAPPPIPVPQGLSSPPTPSPPPIPAAQHAARACRRRRRRSRRSARPQLGADVRPITEPLPPRATRDRRRRRADARRADPERSAAHRRTRSPTIGGIATMGDRWPRHARRSRSRCRSGPPPRHPIDEPATARHVASPDGRSAADRASRRSAIERRPAIAARSRRAAHGDATPTPADPRSNGRRRRRRARPRRRSVPIARRAGTRGRGAPTSRRDRCSTDRSAAADAEPDRDADRSGSALAGERDPPPDAADPPAGASHDDPADRRRAADGSLASVRIGAPTAAVRRCVRRPRLRAASRSIEPSRDADPAIATPPIAGETRRRRRDGRRTQARLDAVGCGSRSACSASPVAAASSRGQCSTSSARRWPRSSRSRSRRTPRDRRRRRDAATSVASAPMPAATPPPMRSKPRPTPTLRPRWPRRADRRGGSPPMRPRSRCADAGDAGAGRRRPAIRRLRAWATLAIASTPAGAHVFLDGADTA